MNHQRQYDMLIAKAQSRDIVKGYVEQHHIVPRSLNGSDDSSNLVALTAREHFIAHMLLAKIYGGTQWLAIMRMKGKQLRYINARLYAIAKRKHAEALRGKPLTAAHKLKIGAVNAGKSRSDITKAKIGAALRGKVHTLQALANMRAARCSRPHTVDAKEKIGAASRARIRKPHTAEAKAKMSFTMRCKSLNKLIDSVFAVPA